MIDSGIVKDEVDEVAILVAIVEMANDGIGLVWDTSVLLMVVSGDIVTVEWILLGRLSDKEPEED